MADLQAAEARWDDPAYVEAQARARLHFVRPGEVGYVVLTEEELASPETTQTTADGCPAQGRSLVERGLDHRRAGRRPETADTRCGPGARRGGRQLRPVTAARIGPGEPVRPGDLDRRRARSWAARSVRSGQWHTAARAATRTC